MTEPPAERRVRPIVDLFGADVEALVELGALDPQPEPEAPPPVAPLTL